MNALTITLGTIGAALSLLCWASFLHGAGRIARTILLGQRDWTRLRPFLPRLKNMLVEFAAHTRMVKFRTAGIAHWFVMIGFLGGSVLWFEAYGQTFDPSFHWPIIGDLAAYHLLDEILGIGTVVGILTLIVIRQVNHPRNPERRSRFRGSKFGPAYFVEYVVLVEGLGMIMVKAGKIATYGHANPWTDFLTMQIAKLLPSSVVMVSVFAFVKLMSGMIWLAVVGRNVTWGVAWHRFSAFPNIYFKREADGGVALGALKPMMSRGEPVNMDDPGEDDLMGVGKIEDFSWKDLLDFTTCTECGRCQSQCPAWNTGKPLSPKLLMMSLREHLYDRAPYLLAGDEAPDAPLIGNVIDPDVLWSCTTCGACVEQCPVDIEHVDHIVDMRRYQVMMESEFPSELAGLFKNLETKGNPWGQNAKDRLNWIAEMEFDIPVFGKDADTFDDYEYLFWVGCAGAYEDRAKKTTKAVAELLATAGVKFMVLGADETCTGDSARRAGNEFLFQQLAQQNVEMLNSVFEGVEERKRKIVVTCAHCFNALNNEYPQVGGTYEVVHHTQLLNRLVRQKKLIPVASVSQDVTYHDPCYLGRHNKVYDAPRELMEASGSKLVEMPRHGDRSFCCGAGGARMWMEEHIGKRINVDRVDEALATNTTKIATGCPFCRVMLSDGVTARQEDGKGEGVEVLDVAQLMLAAVTRLDPAELAENIKVEQKPRPVAEPEPVVVVATEPPTTTPAAQQPAAAGNRLKMKGLAKAPGANAPGTKPPQPTIPDTPRGAAPAAKGLPMKGLAKAPGVKAAAAPSIATDASHTVVPGGKSLQLKPRAKAPGSRPAAAKAPDAAASPAGAPTAPPPKGLPMKGLGKAPGKTPSTTHATRPTRTPDAIAPPAGVRPKGLGLAPGAKPPGRK